MKLASKLMAMAILALVAGSVSAAAVVATTSSAAVGTPIAISVTGLLPTTTYTITANSASITVTPIAPGNTILTDLNGDGSGVSVTGTLAGNYTITADDGVNPAFTTSIVLTDDTLDITINVTLTVPVQVVFSNAGDNSIELAGLSWTLLTRTLNTTYDTVTSDPLDISVKNKGGAAVKVNATVPVDGAWTLVNKTGFVANTDNYWITANGTLDLSAGTPQLVIANIPPLTANVDSTTSLQLHTPSSVSTVTSGAITVRYIASSN